MVYSTLGVEMIVTIITVTGHSGLPSERCDILFSALQFQLAPGFDKPRVQGLICGLAYRSHRSCESGVSSYSPVSLEIQQTFRIGISSSHVQAQSTD